MKANAITRIVIYSIVILLLSSLLFLFLGIGALDLDIGLSDNYTTGDGFKEANKVQKLKIDWAAGSVNIYAIDTNKVSFSESSSSSSSQEMAYKFQNDTLYLSYKKPSLQLGFIFLPSKNLNIYVPWDWDCESIEINAASVTVNIKNVNVSSIELDGASNEVNFQGSFHELSCNGAANRITASCTNVPDEISLDGACIELDLKLPENAAFQVAMDGLSSTFSSDFETYLSDNGYTHGIGGCEIDANGISSKIQIRKGA